ncbi:MAG: hypothetical protein CL931_14870 [Deltaproteobacteria bacterium]|nr:hypothetical protein [Deltaproteobacteria bacterium]
MSEPDSAPDSPPPASGSERPTASLRLRGTWSRFGLWCFGLATSALLRLLGATWRIEVHGDDPRTASPSDPPRLAALFHESMVLCAWLYRDRRYSVAVSRSRDGDLIRSALLALGYAEPARGSSSRGGSAALRQMVRLLGKGTTAAVLIDGPRGPARVAKTGIIAIARHAQIPIQPIAFSARPGHRLSSWDQSLLPLPFSRVVVVYGEPLTVGPDASNDRDEQALARQLERRMVELHHEADAILLDRSRR